MKRELLVAIAVAVVVVVAFVAFNNAVLSWR